MPFYTDPRITYEMNGVPLNDTPGGFTWLGRTLYLVYFFFDGLTISAEAAIEA